MIQFFKKNLGFKFAGLLFLTLCLAFIIMIFSISHINSSQTSTIKNQISTLLNNVKTDGMSQEAISDFNASAQTLKELPEKLETATFSWNILTLLLSFILVMILMLVIFRLMFINPLKILTEDLQHSIQGDERNLTVRVSIDRMDEIGILAGCVDTFISNLDKIIMNIGRKTETIAAASSEVSVVSEQMDTESTDLSEKSNSVAAAAEEMNASMHTVAAASEEASTNISIVADAAGQMQTNITGVAQNCEEARKISSSALEQVDTATEKVGHLGDAANEIGKVTQVITEIAEQTNLLALNATIEAARAGEAGKGFAVVAEEIKNLASQTAGATQSIREQIEGIQQSTEETVHEVSNISQVITNVDGIVNEIVIAIEEQSESATEVATNIEQASIGISEVNENVAQSSQVAAEIASDITTVDSVAADMSERVTNMASGAKDLDKLSVDLRGMISMFKVSLSESPETSDTLLSEKDIPDLFPWTSAMQLSIEEIDTHHKELVRLINQLHKAMRMQKGSSQLEIILNNLVEYTVFHFGFEEELFANFEYPDQDKHIETHKNLIAKINSFKNDFKQGKATVSLDLMGFLKDWLKEHILKTDKQYVPFLKEKMNKS